VRKLLRRLPSWARTTAGIVLSSVLVLLLVAYFREGAPDGRGRLIDSAFSADGRYEVRVFNWHAMLGEDGWDFVIRRRDGAGAYVGCMYSEFGAYYEAVRSVDAGSVRITVYEGTVSFAFDPETMRVTRPIPADLCAGHEYE
jgi:hypothetical protein